MIDHQHVKNAGDVAASGIAGLALISQWAQLLAPIFTLILTFLGIVWWCIRFGEWLADKPDDDDDNKGILP